MQFPRSFLVRSAAERLARVRPGASEHHGVQKLFFRHNSSQLADTKILEEDPIIIPDRIPRGPTDILKAIAATLKEDPTSWSYMYYDDPYLLPVSNLLKREYFLSKESGRKAARYFLSNFPEHFDYNPAVPNVPSFNPQEKFFEDYQDNTIDDLQYCIDNVLVTDAKIVYHNLKEDGIEIPREKKLEVLELLCFFNGKEAHDKYFSEELYFHAEEFVNKNVWDCELAEKIFEEFDDKDSSVYSTMIQGLAKYQDCIRAMSLYEEMLSQGLTPSLNALNGLISCATTLYEDHAKKIEFMGSILQQIEKCGYKPNLETFHNYLEVCSSRLGNRGTAKKYSLQILAEMRAIGLEPSLGTYSQILKVFYKNEENTSQIFQQILSAVENRVFTVRSELDSGFFGTAMRVCHMNIKDVKLAERLYECFKLNEHMVLKNIDENRFYKHLFKLLLETGDLDLFMSWYNKLVPHKYSPELEVFVSFLELSLEKCAIHYIPQLWSDLLIMRLADREETRISILRNCASYKGNDTVLQKQLIEVVRSCRKNLEELNERNYSSARVFSAAMITDMIETYLNGEDFEGAAKEMKRLTSDPLGSPGIPDKKVCLRFVARACEKGRTRDATECARYSAEFGFTEVVDFLKLNAEKYKIGQDSLDRLEDDSV